MAEPIVLVESLSDWDDKFPAAKLVTASDYLSKPSYAKRKAYHVVNFCRNYKYQSVGYYCSLLAEARGHRVIPSVRTIQDLSRKSLYGFDFDTFDLAIQKKLARVSGDLGHCTLKIESHFGHTAVKDLQDFVRQVFEQFPCPILEFEFELGAQASIEAIRPISLRNMDERRHQEFTTAFNQYQARRWRKAPDPKRYKYDLAILVNPQEAKPPSNAKAIQSFVKAGEDLGINVEIISPKDFGRLGEYDALFIRETTALNHHTYRFSRRADQEGMVVMDDPNSILRCTNKVYLAELLSTHKLPTPKTRIFRREDIPTAGQLLGFPLVMKIPEGAFSKGVFKAENAEELDALVPTLFKDTELVLGQQFVYTEFDWRVGVLNRKPLWVCQYKMARKHWQVVKHGRDGKVTEGGFDTLPVEAAPPEVIKTAVEAANLIGDGLYGVDLKQTPTGVVVIEVNDNPNVDAGIEDDVLKKDLYRKIMAEFLRRLELLRDGAGGNPRTPSALRIGAGGSAVG